MCSYYLDGGCVIGRKLDRREQFRHHNNSGGDSSDDSSEERDNRLDIDNNENETRHRKYNIFLHCAFSERTEFIS